MELNLLNLLLVLLAAWLAGNLASRFGYPAVLGELLVGIVLGPPLLGLLHGGEAIAVLAEVGVLLMMLYIGMEVDPGDLKKVSWAGTLAALGGFITPFVLAFLTVRWFGGSVLAGLFVGIAAGVTSLATKSRILVDLKLLDTRVAHVMMAGALIADTLSLIVFSIIIGIAEGGVNLLEIGLVTARIVAFFTVTILVGLRFFPWLGRRLSEAGLTGRTFNFTLVLLIAVLFGELAELAGLHAILGAFLAGLFLRENVLGRTLSQRLMHAVEDASIGFLAPIFFVTAGFEVSFSVFQADLWLFLSIMAVATVGKIVGTALFYLPTGYGWREGIAIGAGMNGRGAVEIIVAQIGLSMGLISQEIFSVLVFMAIFTTAAVPLFLKWGTDWLRRRGELVRRAEERRGVLIIGAGPLARRLARHLQASRPVWLLDTNPEHCRAAQAEGLAVVQGNALQENVLSEAHAAEADTLIAMTPNPEVNTLVAQLARDVFFIPDIHLLQLGREGSGQEAALKRLKATALFGGSVPLNTWNHWISQHTVREVRRRIDQAMPLHELTDPMDRQALPLVIYRENEVLPAHETLRLERGDEVVLLLHEPATESVEVTRDRFDHLVETAPVLDLDESLPVDAFFERVAHLLAGELNMEPATLHALLMEREKEFSSLIAPGLAVPHVVIDQPGRFHMVIARARHGVVFSREGETATVLFVLVRSPEERTFHLRTLSAIAQIVQDPDFEVRWEGARDPEELRRVLRTAERRRYAEAEQARTGE
ncbi:MAG: hypothetical protein KatS3mg043_0415 [Rhodothermaceae bacterium]|nr:MAG: hypothetical protein KatS3mg043_0415 [Rhodothermaceae bacterium]